MTSPSSATSAPPNATATAIPSNLDSPDYGFNFCCSVAAEGLTNRGSELPPIVEYFSEPERIFNIYLRNIKEGLDDFVGGLARRGRCRYA